jgi:hypothetical protein
MSRVSGKVKDSTEGKAESISSVGSEEEDLGDVDREETPDLYRNSALGMYVFSRCWLQRVLILIDRYGGVGFCPQICLAMIC